MRRDGSSQRKEKEKKGCEQFIIARRLKRRQQPGVGVDFAVLKIL
jgi:hypothetical protein